MQSPSPCRRSHDRQRGQQQPCNPLWKAIQAEASEAAEKEPSLRPILEQRVLGHGTLECGLVDHLARRLTEPGDDPRLLRRVLAEVILQHDDLREVVHLDLLAIRQRDPATTSNLTPFLNFKGFHALEASRLTHRLWNEGREEMAFYLQGRISTVWSVDIHPAARIGKGVFIDHATGVVIGETATVGDNAVLLHDVTLGATGKESGDRHPKVEQGVFLGAGAKILGNIRVGQDAVVGAGSIVLNDVPPGATVAGIPAKVVRPGKSSRPAKALS